MRDKENYDKERKKIETQFDPSSSLYLFSFGKAEECS